MAVVGVGLILVVVAFVASRKDAANPTSSAATPPRAAPRYKVEVVSAQPHDHTSFTQGLEIDGTTRYESAGRYGQSRVMAIDQATSKVSATASFPAHVFAEGLTLLPDGKLIVLSWKNGVASVRDRSTLRETGTFTYRGEGWGICYDSRHKRLVMSDGSSKLTFRNPETFVVTGSVLVRNGSTPVAELNELECVDGDVYANVWQTNRIVKIDSATGRVTADIDAAGLLTSSEAVSADVLNGIAATSTEGEFLVTGKLWPKQFVVRFVPA